jgi:RimJ/RimL family protein N-acetyltransferase
MSTVTSRRHQAENGEEFVIRTALPEDASAMSKFLRAVAGESNYLLTQSDEFRQTEDEQRTWIQTHLDAPGQLVVVAEAAAELVGTISFENGSRRRNTHQGMFGMSVREAWRGLGVGRAMLEHLLHWAAGNPLIEKVGLAVFADNAPAVELYRRLGFAEEGRQPKQIKMGHGSYQDLILMYRFVKEAAL